MKGKKGTTLAELLVGSVLFTVFMGISVSLFSSVTKLVSKDQGPSEQLLEGRVAVLKICQRLRNCRAMVEPPMNDLIFNSTPTLLLRDRVLGRTVRIEIQEGVLRESHYPLDYDSEAATDEVVPLKQLRLAPAHEFRVSGGGMKHPTRLVVSLTLADGRQVRATTNLREAL